MKLKTVIKNNSKNIIPIKIFEHEDKEQLEKDIYTWTKENHMEINSLSICTKGEKYVCAVLCSIIDYGF